MATRLDRSAATAHSALGRPPFYRFSTWAMRVLFGALARISVRGVENVPHEGPLIVVANHIHWTDPVILGAVFPRPLIFMAKRELWRFAPIGWIVDHYGAFPVRRGEADRVAIRRALEILDAGGAVGIFPEGTRSRNGALGRPHPGASLLALKSGAAVLPVGITGTDSLRGISWLGRRPAVQIVYGVPFHLARVGENGRGRTQDATDRLMRSLAALLPAERRGSYGE